MCQDIQTKVLFEMNKVAELSLFFFLNTVQKAVLTPQNYDFFFFW